MDQQRRIREIDLASSTATGSKFFKIQVDLGVLEEASKMSDGQSKRMKMARRRCKEVVSLPVLLQDYQTSLPLWKLYHAPL